jgi:site-specific DNA-methyltransferase (adenine-specific)
MNDIFNENVPLKTETPAFAKHVLPAVPSSEVHLEDCVTALKRYADNHFDLAIVDPPYGINISSAGGYYHVKGKGQANPHTKKDWDSGIPTEEYWQELFRVSKNQIVWGGNYMTEFLSPSRCWIFWDKMKFVDNYADGELAWTSFDRNTKKVEIQHHGFLTKDGKSIHPTQKPVMLYEWTLMNFAKEGDKILDTHLGSGSSRIAAYKGGFNFVGFEIDKEYYEKQEKRFNDFKSQLRLF